MNAKNFMFLLLLITISASFSLNATEGKISGTIDYEGQSTGKIYIATVSFPPDPDKWMLLDSLDAPGYFEIDNLKDGRYFIGAFLDANGNQIPGFDEPMGIYPSIVIIEAGSWVENVNINLKHLPRGTGSISGKVDYIGPMTGEVHVYALGLSKTPFNSAHFTWGQNDQYLIEGLLPGDYLLVAYMDVNGNGLPELDEPLGVVEEKIHLGSGERLENIDLYLFDTEMHNNSISGTVFRNGANNGNIHVFAAGLSFTPLTEVIADSISGAFQIENLAFGQYYLFSYVDVDENNSYDLGEPFSESYLDEIRLGQNQDTTGIEIQIVTQGTGMITGQVDYHGDKRKPILTVGAGLSATPLGLGGALPIGNPPWNYMIPNLAPGIYVVGGLMNTTNNPIPELDQIFECPLGFYMDDFVYVEQGETVENINFTLVDTTNCTLAGTIFAPQGVSGNVHIYTLGLSISPFKETIISEAGDYEVTDLGAGLYIVVAFMDTNGDSMYSLNEPIGFKEKLIKLPDNTIKDHVNIQLTAEPSTEVAHQQQPDLPQEYSLLPNYPNPFNPSTTLRYLVPKASHVTIKIYNIIGKEVATLVNRQIDAGYHEVAWDTQNIENQVMSSGIYICQMQAGSFVESRKIMLVR